VESYCERVKSPKSRHFYPRTKVIAQAQATKFTRFLAGTAVAFRADRKGEVIMKTFPENPDEQNPAPRPNFVAILTIVTEMAKRLNENISKVRLQPMRSAFLAVKETPPTSKAAAD
jgi:hypothetical protein